VLTCFNESAPQDAFLVNSMSVDNDTIGWFSFKSFLQVATYHVNQCTALSSLGLADVRWWWFNRVELDGAFGTTAASDGLDYRGIGLGGLRMVPCSSVPIWHN